MANTAGPAAQLEFAAKRNSNRLRPRCKSLPPHKTNPCGMGCICSFFKTLTSYHGSHLTAHQVTRQRQQRARKPRQPSRDSPPLMTPPPPPIPLDKDLRPPPLKGVVPPQEEERLLTFAPQKRHKLADCGRQSSLKLGASFSKS